MKNKELSSQEFSFKHFGKIIHGILIIILVIVYSIYLFNGVNEVMSRHTNYALEEEYKKNPGMKKDIDKYRSILLEGERNEADYLHILDKIKKIQEQAKINS